MRTLITLKISAERLPYINDNVEQTAFSYASMLAEASKAKKLNDVSPAREGFQILA